MPREPRSTVQAVVVDPTADLVIPTASLVASGERFDKSPDTMAVYQAPKDWQRECYRHFEICGEARYAAVFFGNALSRAVLRIGKRSGDGVKTQTTGQAVAYLHELFNGPEGQSQMLASMGIHLTIAGECWLVGRKVDGVPLWEVVSVLELDRTGRGGGWQIRYDDGRPPVDLKLGGGGDVAIRIWTPHPGKRLEADSPFRSLLPILAEIEWSTRHVFKQLSSRLAGAGLLLLPQSATFPSAPVGPTTDGRQRGGTTEELTGIMRVLARVMSLGITNPEHPAASVPIVAKVPDETVDKIKLLQFWSELDSKVLEIRNQAAHRFAVGMNLPVEAVEGMSSNPGTGGGSTNGVSHWGAWQIEEQTIKMFIEPMLDMVVNAITIYYLRPAMGKDPQWVVIHDTSALRLRPDRSAQSVVLYNLGLVKAEVVLREHGFDPSDAMDDPGRKTWLLMKIAGGSATPEQVQAAASQLGVELPGAVPPASDPREARPAPSLRDVETRPRTPLEAVASILPVTEALTLTALSRAGSRMRQTAKRKGVEVPVTQGFATHTVYQCNGTAAEYLADLFPHADIVLDGVAENPAKVVDTLKTYCHQLLIDQQPHSRERLAEALVAAGC